MPSSVDDPLLRSARREAIIVFLIFAAALGYTVGYYKLFGYGRSIADLKFVYGFPDWVFWGLIVPWGASTLVSFLFGAFYMRDEELGQDPEGSSEGDFEFAEAEHV